MGWRAQKALIEPFIQNYHKFNSNTGWTDARTTDWSLAMQALSHFSYHVSGGNYVLCDIQGGVYQQEVVLSDPAILSRTYEYGETDLGPEGISAFFSNHACSKYCRPHWTAPADPVEHYRPVSSTNMIRHTVSTAKSKPMGTFAEEPDEDGW